MSQRAENSVLHRMSQGKSNDLGLSQMSIAKAMRLAFAKAGDEVLDAAILVRDVAEATIIPDALDTDVPNPALLLRLTGPAGSRAVAIVCMQVVGAVIEAQTIGHILSTPAADRTPTRTDAALVSGFLNLALAGFGRLVQDCDPAPPFDGFECGPTLQDLRAAQMALEDVAHIKLSLDLDFADGAKTGVIHFILPAARQPHRQGGKAQDDWHETLENAVLGTSARLEAVLSKLKLPLSKVSTFAKDDVIPLVGASVDGVVLVGSDGSTVIRARLGRSGPVRAVRLYMSGIPPRAPQKLDDKSPIAAKPRVPEPPPVVDEVAAIETLEQPDADPELAQTDPAAGPAPDPAESMAPA